MLIACLPENMCFFFIYYATVNTIQYYRRKSLCRPASTIPAHHHHLCQLAAHAYKLRCAHALSETYGFNSKTFLPSANKICTRIATRSSRVPKLYNVIFLTVISIIIAKNIFFTYVYNIHFFKF